MKKIRMEVPCMSVRDVLVAAAAGVDQIDLGSTMEVDKVTGSVGALRISKQLTDIPIYMMVRPRPQGFNYDEYDFQAMLYDAKNFIENGADGICFGLLHEDATINVERTRQMVDVIGEKDSIFNRAFDRTPDLEVSIQQLIQLKVTRVLTSGGLGNIMDNLDKIRYLQDTYGEQINIIVGGGVRDYNAKEILQRTNVDQIHFSGKINIFDNSYYVMDEREDKELFTYIGVGEAEVKSIMDEVRKAELLRK